MKKNKTLKIAGIALIIWLLLKKKKTTSAGEENNLNIAPNTQQTRFKQKSFNSLQKTTRKPADINGVII
jgi:hypothetical protein